MLRQQIKVPMTLINYSIRTFAKIVVIAEIVHRFILTY